MIQGIFNEPVTIKRRGSYTTASRDSINDPIYGAPTASWTTVYTGMMARLAFVDNKLRFAQTGERLEPAGTMYFDKSYLVLPEDRVITSGNVEYVVVGVVAGYVLNTVIDHWEAILALP